MNNGFGASLVILSLAVTASGEALQEASARSGQPGEPSIQLTLLSRSGPYKLNEQVLIGVRIKNISTVEYCEWNVLEMGEAQLNEYRPRLADSKGEFLDEIVRERPRHQDKVKDCLPPGQSLSELLTLNHLFKMTTPGDYRLAVTHRESRSGVIVSSPEVKIQLVE